MSEDRWSVLSDSSGVWDLTTNYYPSPYSATSMLNLSTTAASNIGGDVILDWQPTANGTTINGTTDWGSAAISSVTSVSIETIPTADGNYPAFSGGRILAAAPIPEPSSAILLGLGGLGSFASS